MTRDDMKPEERIDQYLLGQATAEDIKVLNELLTNDPQLRKLYRFRVAMEGGYREAAIRDESSPVERALLPVDSNEFDRSDQTGRSARLTVIRYGFAVLAASAITVGLIAITLWNLIDQETPEYGGFAASRNPVARVVASVDADWRDTEPMSGGLLEAGRFRLDAGTVELEFNRGARVTLQGPSSFELKSTDLLHVSSGILVARIPEEAIGFTITTEEAEVVDLGTEFGLSVNVDGQTDVHVLDGLVEVLPRNQDAAGIMIAEGQARRFHTHRDTSSAEIPVRSREALIGDQRFSNLGVRMLRGSVRMTDRLGPEDYEANMEGQHWINLIAEKQEVSLGKPLKVTLNSPGRYRKFDGADQIPAGIKVNSYLLHFRPTSRVEVRGVIRFDQPILGVVCVPKHLEASDPIVGVASNDYPIKGNPRGLEPGPYFDEYVERAGMPTDFQPDEVILSQDRSTISIRASADPKNGYYDQVRILTQASE